MAEGQILVTGSADAPVGYTVPNTVELLTKAVSAVFDGTGASGDFVPLLEIISDGGVVVAQSKGDQVTAGGSVEQSWFPRVAATATAASGTLPWCFGDNSGFSCVGDGSNVVVQMTGGSFAGGTSDSAIMDFADDGSGDWGIELKVEGIYVVWGSVQTNPIADLTLSHSVKSSFSVAGAGQFGIGLLPFTPGIGHTLSYGNSSWMELYNLGPDSVAPPQTIVYRVAQDSGSTLTTVGNVLALRISDTDNGNF